MAVSAEASTARRFRFAGVVVDEGAARLQVDGRPCRCSQRALHLLLNFCESPGKTLGRKELMERLWPGGQLVADEALTQAVFRARAVLGIYASCIVTVRGIGFRLDADVAVIGANDADATTGSSAASSPVGVAADPTAPQQRIPDPLARSTAGRVGRWLVAAVLLLLFVLACFWWSTFLRDNHYRSGHALSAGIDPTLSRPTAQATVLHALESTP